MTQAIPQDPPLLANGRFSTSWQRFFIGLNTTGSGSVTSVSIVPANGVSGTVGTPTTTPAISLALGNITPTQVACTGAVTGTNLSGTSSGTNTGDETTATIKTKLGVTTLSGSNTGDQTISLTGDVTGSGTGSFAATVGKIGGQSVSLAGSLTTSGSFASTFTMTGVTTVTFPTSGTLAVVNGALGTPTSVTLTNATGLPIASGISGLGTGVAAFLATPSSANLATAVTDETGTGALVFGTNPTIANLVVTVNGYVQQGAPASIAAAATLTANQMLGGIIQYTGAAAALTLPAGALMDATVVAGLAVDRAFDVYFVNTGSGAATVSAGAAFSIVGAGVVTNGTSGHFRCRKTAANTFVAYRVS